MGRAGALGQQEPSKVRLSAGCDRDTSAFVQFPPAPGHLGKMKFSSSVLFL